MARRLAEVIGDDVKLVFILRHRSRFFFCHIGVVIQLSQVGPFFAAGPIEFQIILFDLVDGRLEDSRANDDHEDIVTAIEEFAETSQRFEFLSSQKTDLERAVERHWIVTREGAMGGALGAGGGCACN